ncbi:DNA helicase B-like [Glandiceps talaboti]
MAGKRKTKFYEIITGRFMPEPDNAGEDDDADDDEEGDGEDVQWLDSREMNSVSGGASLVKPGNLPLKTVRIYRDDTKRPVSVRGKFLLSGPWWNTEVKVEKGGQAVKLMSGYPSYKICKKPTKDILSLFLIKGCCVEASHVQTFIDTTRQMGVKLSFNNLIESVEEFGKMKEEYAALAKNIQNMVLKSVEGKFAVRALKFPNLMWYLPKLLPKHAAAILIRESDEVLEKLETAIADEPWVFGFSPILRWQLKIIGCEAWLESFKQCNLLAEMPDHIRDALCIYHVMKNDCRSYGHTYLYENYMKRSRSFQGYIVKDWNKAYKFLEKHYVILKDGNRMYLRRYWKYEQMIADSLAELQQRESWSIDFDWAGHKDFQTDGEQQQACRMMCENPITVMSGKGGCGKTHVVSRVFEAAAIEILKTLSDRVKAGKEDEEDAGIAEMSGGRDDDDSEPKILEDPHILLTAPMGKAASLLGRRARLPAFTLHQVMYSFYNSEKDDHGKPVNWKYSIVKALIVDESSMVSVQVFCTVLDILMKHSELCKVVFLGDINQLPSIQPGNFLTDLYRSYDAIGWSISLLTNHRTESELIIQNATRISKQLQPRFDSNHGFHNICINDIRNETLNETSFLSTTLQQQESFEIDGAIRNLLSSKEPRIQDHRKSQFVAFRRIDCERINELCCKHYSSHPTRNHKNKLDFRKGDKICMTQNANVCNLATKKTVRLCNGEIFFIMEYIEKIDEKNRKTIEVTLQDEDRTLRVDFREVRKKCKARHSWARTIHTYQVRYIPGLEPFVLTRYM